MTPNANWRFGALLIVSVALHAAVLFGVPRPGRPEGPALPPLIASLRPAALPPVAERPAPVARRLPARPEAVASEGSRPRIPHKARSVPARPVPVLAMPSSTATPPVALEPVAAAPAKETAVPAVAQSPAGAAPIVQAQPSAGDGAEARAKQLQADLLASYRQQLTRLFASQQSYPRIAAMRGWEGEVRLRLVIARKGSLVAVRIEHSSGHEVLDHHAMVMLEIYSSSLPPLPAGLNAGEIQVVVPVSYKLKKAT